MIDESWYRRPAGVPDRISAGGVVVRVEGGRVYVALAREADFPGYVLPKGGVEAGESLEEAARREIAEEAGLTDLTLLGGLGRRERLSFDKSRWLTVHFFVFLTDQEQSNPGDPNHPHGATWFPLDQLPEMFWPEQRELVETNVALIRDLLYHRRADVGRDEG